MMIGVISRLTPTTLIRLVGDLSPNARWLILLVANQLSRHQENWHSCTWCGPASLQDGRKAAPHCEWATCKLNSS